MAISTESEDQHRKLGIHHLFNQIDDITTREVSVGTVFQFQNFC